MTSTTDTAGHPDVTEISDLTEGLLPPSRTADVRRHLDGCALCADVYDSLEEIRGMLGTLPGPPRMPADVAGRIDAALAAEALLSATAPEADDDTNVPASVSASQPLSGEDEGRHVSRETSATADRPSGHPRASTGPGRTNRPRRGRRRTVVLGAMFTAATLGLGGLLLQSLGDTSGNNPGSASREQSDSANTFAGEKLDNEVAGLLAEAKKSEKKDGSPRTAKPYGTDSTEEPNILNTPTSVPECIKQGIGRDAAPLAFKEGDYDGTEAYLVVLPDASDAAQVTAYVVDSACVDRPSISEGKVLLQQSYPRS
ncbi:anti-sigma factor family protein [Streptomyces albicerus]|uniref:anti-sigma factor family protein n=1 Tax=Streptomyces albicerus TaxID=2569859 RepID=UPI00124B98BE|nr:hypothetical protein [Streptomyces albicerus]